MLVGNKQMAWIITNVCISSSMPLINEMCSLIADQVNRKLIELLHSQIPGGLTGITKANRKWVYARLVIYCQSLFIVPFADK